MIRSYWQTYQPIGLIFGLDMAVGFIIGVAICYQILFTDINDHLPQFAIGHGNKYLRRIVAPEGRPPGDIRFYPTGSAELFFVHGHRRSRWDPVVAHTRADCNGIRFGSGHVCDGPRRTWRSMPSIEEPSMPRVRSARVSTPRCGVLYPATVIERCSSSLRTAFSSNRIMCL